MDGPGYPYRFLSPLLSVSDLLSISVPTSGASLAAPHVYPHAFLPWWQLSSGSWPERGY